MERRAGRRGLRSRLPFKYQDGKPTSTSSQKPSQNYSARSLLSVLSKGGGGMTSAGSTDGKEASMLGTGGAMKEVWGTVAPQRATPKSAQAREFVTPGDQNRDTITLNKRSTQQPGSKPKLFRGLTHRYQSARGGSQQKNKISDTAMNVGTRMTKESEKQSRQREAKLPVVSRPSGVATSLSVDENQDPMNGSRSDMSKSYSQTNSALFCEPLSPPFSNNNSLHQAKIKFPVVSGTGSSKTAGRAASPPTLDFQSQESEHRMLDESFSPVPSSRGNVEKKSETETGPCSLLTLAAPLPTTNGVHTPSRKHHSRQPSVATPPPNVLRGFAVKANSKDNGEESVKSTEHSAKRNGGDWAGKGDLNSHGETAAEQSLRSPLKLRKMGQDQPCATEDSTEGYQRQRVSSTNVSGPALVPSGKDQTRRIRTEQVNAETVNLSPPKILRIPSAEAALVLPSCTPRMQHSKSLPLSTASNPSSTALRQAFDFRSPQCDEVSPSYPPSFSRPSSTDSNTSCSSSTSPHHNLLWGNSLGGTRPSRDSKQGSIDGSGNSPALRQVLRPLEDRSEDSYSRDKRDLLWGHIYSQQRQDSSASSLSSIHACSSSSFSSQSSRSNRAAPMVVPSRPSSDPSGQPPIVSSGSHKSLTSTSFSSSSSSSSSPSSSSSCPPPPFTYILPTCALPGSRGVSPTNTHPQGGKTSASTATEDQGSVAAPAAEGAGAGGRPSRQQPELSPRFGSSLLISPQVALQSQDFPSTRTRQPTLPFSRSHPFLPVPAANGEKGGESARTKEAGPRDRDRSTVNRPPAPRKQRPNLWVDVGALRHDNRIVSLNSQVTRPKRGMGSRPSSQLDQHNASFGSGSHSHASSRSSLNSSFRSNHRSRRGRAVSSSAGLVKSFSFGYTHSQGGMSFSQSGGATPDICTPKDQEINHSQVIAAKRAKWTAELFAKAEAQRNFELKMLKDNFKDPGYHLARRNFVFKLPSLASAPPHYISLSKHVQPTFKLDGELVAREWREEIEQRVQRLKEENGGKVPHLAVVLANDRPDSRLYVEKKVEACKRLGIHAQLITINPGESGAEEKMQREIEELNRDSGVTGVIVQKPLPKGWDWKRADKAISPEKDVDCVHPSFLGELLLGHMDSADTSSGFRRAPCCPLGVMRLLNRYGINVMGLKSVVIGKSMIVGTPLAKMLERRLSTVVVCDRHTRSLEAVVRDADLVFVCAGSPGLLRGEWLKRGVVVVDIGINDITEPTPATTTQTPKACVDGSVQEGEAVVKRRKRRIVGDVDVVSVSEKASYLTPVPGGVGPVTVAAVLDNLLGLFEEQQMREQ